MVTRPFKTKESQRITSIIAMIVGIMLMVINPAINSRISSFVLGAIITLIGFIYFLDVQ